MDRIATVTDTDRFATLTDVLARDRRSPDPALVHAPTGRSYDYRRALTTAWKVALFLRNEGVRGGMAVAVADDDTPEAVLSFLGAGLLGATVSFSPERLDDAKALVAPTDRLDEFDAGPGTRLVGYGAEPADPSVAYFERDVWSENPTLPPDRPAPDDPLLAAAGETYGHGDLVGSALSVAEAHEFGPDTEVVVRARLTRPGVVVAGVLAPLVAGAVSVVPDEETVGDVAVGDGPEPVVVDPDTLP